MKFVFIYLIFSFSLFLANIASSQESGVKEIIKRQQVKIQLIENNLKSLIGKLESKTQSSSQDKSIINKLNDIETKLGKITSQFKNLSEFAYALEFKINRIETNLNLSPALKSYKNKSPKILMHCFTGSYLFAKKLLDLNAFFSASGIITFKNSKDLQETFSKIPLEKLLIETDSPYLAPIPMRGKKNEPSYVRFIAEKLSSIKKIDLKSIKLITTENFNNLFFRNVS